MVMHTISSSDILKHSDRRYTGLYLRWRASAALLLISPLHRIHLLASLRWSISLIQSYSQSRPVLYSLLYHSDNRSIYSILFLFRLVVLFHFFSLILQSLSQTSTIDIKHSELISSNGQFDNEALKRTIPSLELPLRSILEWIAAAAALAVKEVR